MINAEDKPYYDSRLSCTEEEAVAKMIGWMQGSIRKRYTKVTEHGIPAEELPFLHSLVGPLFEQLEEQRESALQVLYDAAEADEDLHEKYEVVDKLGESYNKAVLYMSGIRCELNKGESSVLIIDQRATDSSGITHLFLASVDKWALKEYSIRILDDTQSSTENTQEPQALPPVNLRPEQASLSKKVERTRLLDQEDAILAEVKRLGHDPKCLPKRAPGKKGMKAAVKSSLINNELFTGTTNFKRAWDRLLEKKLVAEKK